MFYVKKSTIEIDSSDQCYDLLRFQVARPATGEETEPYLLNHCVNVENCFRGQEHTMIEFDVRRELAHDPEAPVVFLEEEELYPWE